MKKILAATAVIALAIALLAGADERSAGEAKGEAPVKIRITVGGAELTAEMNVSPAARDFLSLLPLTLTLQDYAGTEKIGYPPRKLTTEGSPPGIDPSVGDIAYYAPWGNLALYYKDFGYSSGLVLLGRIESGVEALRGGGSVEARFELMK